MIDSHVHLNATQFDTIVDETIKKSMAAGVNAFICIGYDAVTNMKAIAISETYDNVYCTIGFHPEVAKMVTEADLLSLEEMLKHPKVVGIGECGLDYYWDKSAIEEQKFVFKSQIELANKLNLPLIIHMRDSAFDTLEMIKNYKAKSTSGIMHCYSGSAQMVTDFVNENLYISVAGPVTFKNAVTPKEVAKVIPIERLLIETDAPYLAPMPYRGKQNTPEYLPYTLAEIARIREMDKDLLDQITEANTIRLFQLNRNK
ncbi:MAG: hydrolase TatD [Tenericutes bacterium HGW-Tenericutes-1]|jgi:TatD DNase family protein|nr:MAG: hydrolase TatD [Tenericutes bacterium HGW-Tenericutes-1]